MAKKKATPTELKVKITKPVAGVFMLPFNVGQVVSVELKQAKEMIDLGYAEEVIL